MVKIIELKLPVNFSKSVNNKDIYHFGNTGGSLIFYYDEYHDEPVECKAYINLARKTQDRLKQIYALKENASFDLCQYWSQKIQKYPIEQICYRIEAPKDMWLKLWKEIDEEHLTLSLYIDHSQIDGRDYKEVYTQKYKSIVRFSGNNKPYDPANYALEITVVPIDFQLSEEIYWLTDSPLQIRVFTNCGDFGFYGEDLLYPVDKFKLEEFSESYSAKTTYSIHTAEYQLGKQAVQRVMSALNNIKGLKGWETGENSIADVKYKWDLIIEVNDKCYPVQIKSSLSYAEESYDEYEDLYKEREIPFIPPIFYTNFNSSIDKITEYFQAIFQLSSIDTANLTKNTNNKRYSQNKRRNLYRRFEAQIRQAASEGTWNLEAEQSLQNLVEIHYSRGKQIDFCHLIAEARTIQAEFIKSQLNS